MSLTGYILLLAALLVSVELWDRQCKKWAKQDACPHYSTTETFHAHLHSWKRDCLDCGKQWDITAQKRAEEARNRGESEGS